jgi:thiol-disulfide isomerase/thioredoxin
MKKNYFILIGLFSLIMLLSVGCKDEAIQGESNGADNGSSQEISTAFNFPEEPADKPGLTSFSTLDIYGETVDQTVFSESEVTMVNIWGTFCSPCLAEMPYLAEIDTEFEDQGFNIVGIAVDVQNGDGSVNLDQVMKAQQIAADTGANYSHLLPSNNLISGLISKVQYIPHTVFVDSQGQIISEEFVGSRSKEEWVEIIESML